MGAATGELRSMGSPKSELTKASLTPRQREVLELMQEMNFGRIQGLVVRAGEPCLKPRPRVIFEIKLGSESGPRSEREMADFALRKEFQEFFAHLKRLKDGVIDVEVHHGLPFRLSFERSRSCA
jgi:hypothetical protein